MSIRDVFLVAGGGAVGAVARYGASVMCGSLFGDRFPWGTLLVNVVGCFLLFAGLFLAGFFLVGATGPTTTITST